MFAADSIIGYQEIIDKHFPGFIILSPSDIDYNYADMSSTKVEAIKGDAHFLLANFNDDGIPDFVAKVCDEVKRFYPKSKYRPVEEYEYSGGTVACVSKSTKEYDCEFLWKTPTYSLPRSRYLIKIPKGTEMGCPHEDNLNPYTGEMGIMSFVLKTDAVGDLRLMGAGDSFYILIQKVDFLNVLHQIEGERLKQTEKEMGS